MDDTPTDRTGSQPAAQVEHSEHALAAKQSGAMGPDHPETGDHADEGLKSIPFEDQSPSGAFNAEGHRPVLERSRKVR